MRTKSLFSDSACKPILTSGVSKEDTAYWIFDKAALYQYSVNNTHFRMVNGQGDLPIPYSGNRYDLERVLDEQITTIGRIIDMVNYFMDGASLGLSPKVSCEVYKRIGDHLGRHSELMRSSLTYMMPNPEDFRNMAEFALSIRGKALLENPELDTKAFNLGIFAGNGSPIILTKAERTAAVVRDEVIPKPLAMMDAIERYLHHYGE